MLGRVRGFEIDMYVCALDIWQALQLHLKVFRDIVRFAKAEIGVHDDIDLDYNAWARVPCANSVELNHPRIVGHRHVGDMIQE